MPLTVEDSDQISLCQSPFMKQDNFSVSFPWHSNQSVILGRVSLAHLCTVNLCNIVLIFYTKAGSIFLVIAELSPKHEIYSLELYILFRPYESCFLSRILLGETE